MVSRTLTNDRLRSQHKGMRCISQNIALNTIDTTKTTSSPASGWMRSTEIDLQMVCYLNSTTTSQLMEVQLRTTKLTVASCLANYCRVMLTRADATYVGVVSPGG